MFRLCLTRKFLVVTAIDLQLVQIHRNKTICGGENSRRTDRVAVESERLLTELHYWIETSQRRCGSRDERARVLRTLTGRALLNAIAVISPIQCHATPSGNMPFVAK